MKKSIFTLILTVLSVFTGMQSANATINTGVDDNAIFGGEDCYTIPTVRGTYHILNPELIYSMSYSDIKDQLKSLHYVLKNLELVEGIDAAECLLYEEEINEYLSLNPYAYDEPMDLAAWSLGTCYEVACHKIILEVLRDYEAPEEDDDMFWE